MVKSTELIFLPHRERGSFPDGRSKTPSQAKQLACTVILHPKASMKRDLLGFLLSEKKRPSYFYVEGRSRRVVCSFSIRTSISTGVWIFSRPN